ncbi:NAD(P)-binding domain-containing protein [Nocardia sp. CC201C]|uniref:NAD(P)-dependent oxidoreductase n=1 Tax=Nocardia sp. CC201C TaxID=3044575 RepID=UPI0024A84D42|nr:NAD(P)-binding domain-containing protein [Nocardia sp. CC201C]
MNTTPQSVTVLGLGQMGSALAAALLDRGHRVTVWNRSAHKAQALVDRGAVLAADPRRAVEASPLVLVCVFDQEAMRELTDPIVSELAGKALVNLTSCGAEQARAAAEWFGARGVDYLDGGIMTTPPGVGSSEVMFLYSGAAAAFEPHRETLAALGDPLYLGADAGIAALYDSALLNLMWSTMTGWLHGVALVGAEQVAAQEFTPIAIRWLATVNSFLTRYATQVDEGSYPGDDATVDVQIATIDHVLHEESARGIDTALPELLKSTMLRARESGHGSDSFASVIEVLRKGVAS